MIKCTFEDGAQTSLRHAVVDVLIIQDNKILMVKRTAKLLQGGKWGIVGGYVDRDETVAHAAAREVLEETGWQIRNLQLLTVIDNPDRPQEDRQNIAFIFLAEAVEQTGQPDWESDEVKWFPLDDLPSREQIAFDHSDSIDLYKRYLKENFTLPVLPALLN